MWRFRIVLIGVLLTQQLAGLKADEGMWIPLLLKNYNIDDMQKSGLKLSAEDIYSINNTSLKDAIVIFGGGCTGELISDEGLLITNHHCGFYYIQKHSSLENDYLTDGFWAMSKQEEIPNPGLTVTFLVKMEDVTDRVFKGISDTLNESERSGIIAETITEIKEKEGKDNNYEIVIKPFFNGNEYYMFVNEVYKDVRMVGAPPSAIGKFGGDTDNWMWPRHTGDFSLFRIYADKDNKPAEYSKDNIPYKPKKHLPISLKGVNKGDFTMVYGYPGTTQEYLTSHAVKLILETENPHQIALRNNRLDIMRFEMEQDPEVRIKYASKYARVANYWKKWIGESRGLRKLDAIEKKEVAELEFQTWVKQESSRSEKYGSLLENYKKLYENITPYNLAFDYIVEGIYAIEVFSFSRKVVRYINEMSSLKDEEEMEKAVKRMAAEAEAFFKDYHVPIDKNICGALLSRYGENLDPQWHPAFFKVVDSKFSGDYNAYAEYLFSNSVLVSKEKLTGLLNTSPKSLKKLKKDPAILAFSDVNNLLSLVYMSKSLFQNEIDKIDRLYIKALQEMNKDKKMYPDANFTLRLSYGKVDDYFPRDGVHYNYYTVLDGIIQKDDPDIYDYRVPEKLKRLYEEKDYGPYAQDGTVHVCFTASNHTTGGNSGSPVINGNGELIGVNFDRNWEGTMSDIMYDPDQCRNITLDIRYALFIVDKFAGAGHLIEEMTIVK